MARKAARNCAARARKEAPLGGPSSGPPQRSAANESRGGRAAATTGAARVRPERSKNLCAELGNARPRFARGGGDLLNGRVASLRDIATALNAFAARR